MDKKIPSVALDFLEELQKGKTLCLMPLPRVEIGLDPINVLDNFKIYSAREIDLQELNVVSYPLLEIERAEAEQARLAGAGQKVFRVSGEGLSWLQSGATRISLEHFNHHSLIAFACDVSGEQLFEASHKEHIGIIRAMAEYAERAVDVIRFERCRLDLPDSLPGHAGTFDLETPFSAALFYFLQDNEAYVVGGQCITHLIAIGIGLELEIDPGIVYIGNGEVGHLARRALAMFTEALESNSETDKFVRAMSILEFIASPGKYLGMTKAKSEIASHIAQTRQQYHDLCGRLRQLTDKNSIRTRIVHLGERLEAIMPEADMRRALFLELQEYIGKPIEDMISMSDHEWSEVVAFRQRRKRDLGVDRS